MNQRVMACVVDKAASLARVPHGPFDVIVGSNRGLADHNLDSLSLVFHGKKDKSFAFGVWTTAALDWHARAHPHPMRPPEVPVLPSVTALSKDALAAALDCIVTATFLVRANGHLVHGNRAGHRLLRVGGALRQVHACLVARRAEEAKTLATGLVRVAASRQAELLRFVNRNGTGRLLISVSPIPDDDLVTVCAVDLQAGNVDFTQWFRRAFQVSTQNAELASGLLSGLNLSEFSVQKEVTLGATRTRLKKLLAATGTRSQSALVATLLRAATLEFSQ